MSGYPQILWITLCAIPADPYWCFWDQELSALVKKSPAKDSYFDIFYNSLYCNNKSRMKVFCAYLVAGRDAF